MVNQTVVYNLLPYVSRETSTPIPKEAIHEYNTRICELIGALTQIQVNLNGNDSIMQHQAAITLNNILIVTSHVIEGQAQAELKEVNNGN